MASPAASKDRTKSYKGAGTRSLAQDVRPSVGRGGGGGAKQLVSFAGVGGHLASAKGVQSGFGHNLTSRKGRGAERIADSVTSKDFRKDTAKRGWWLKGAAGGDAEGEAPEVNVEVEPRSFCSAVSRDGKMLAKECYRCLTTFCHKWHKFGKLELPMCHGCVVLLGKGNKCCGYCGLEEERHGGRSLFNCRLCVRPTHEACEQKWRSVGHNVNKICIVCEMGARIRDRDYAQRAMQLWEGDLPSVLNHHIFFFERYFKGMGPSKGAVWKPRAPIIAGELYTSGEAAAAKSKRERQAADRRAAGVRGARAGLENAPFDELVELMGRHDVHVQENSEISNIVQKFARKWDSLSHETIILPDLDELKRRRDEMAIIDAGSAALLRSTNATQQGSLRQIQALDVLDGLAFPLRELGYCYLTRPFPVGASADDLNDPSKLDYSGVYRRLDPIQALFLFASDLNLCPQHVTKVQAREIIFQTLGENPKFGNMCKYVQRGGGGLEQVDVERMTRSMATLSASVSAMTTGSMRMPSDSEFVSLAYGEDGVFKQEQKPVRLEKVFGSFFRRVVRYKSIRSRRAAADGGPGRLRTPSSPGASRRGSEGMDHAMAAEVQAMVSESQLDDPEYVQMILSKYPTTEELEVLEEEQLRKQEQIQANADIVAGQRVPYELTPPVPKSQQFLNWQAAFIDAFNFFADPPEQSIMPPPPPYASLDRTRSDENAKLRAKWGNVGHDKNHTMELEECFRKLDLDEDNMISRRDAEESFNSAALADVFMMTFFPTADPDGVSWAEFVSDRGDALGSLWVMLLTEAEGVQERITRGVMLLQRSCATPWLERNGKEKGHHIIPVFEEDTKGLGIMVLVDPASGKPVVSKVVRPGPADEVLFSGDIIEAVDDKSFDNMLPGRAIGYMCGLWGNPPKGHVKLGIRRDDGMIIHEKIERFPPDPPVQISLEKNCLQRAPKGKVSFVDLGKMFRVLGLIPSILCDEELALLLDEVREGGDYKKDEELLVEWDDFIQLCISLTRKRNIFYKINKKNKGKRTYPLLRPTGDSEEPPVEYPVPPSPPAPAPASTAFKVKPSPSQSPLQGAGKLQRVNALAEAGIDWAADHYQDGTRELGLAGPLLVSHSVVEESDSRVLEELPAEPETPSQVGRFSLKLPEAFESFGSEFNDQSGGSSPMSLARSPGRKFTWGPNFVLSPKRKRKESWKNAQAPPEEDDECLARLFDFMRLPKCDGPLGRAWIEARHTQYLKTNSEAGRSDDKDRRIWQSPKALIRSDGVHRYIQRCRELGVPPIRNVLEQLRDLKSTVVLTNYTIGVPGAKALAASLVGNAHIVELVLHGCGLSDEGVEALCEALKGNRKLSILDISDNRIGSRTISGVESKDVSRCVSALAQLFKVPQSTLYSLRLSSCGLTDRDALELTKGLKGNHSLSKLDLSRNEIGDKGAAGLAKCVQFREHLEFVNLTWNRFSPEGLKLIQHAVRIRNRAKKITPSASFEMTPRDGGQDLSATGGSEAGHQGSRDALVGDVDTPFAGENTTQGEQALRASKEQQQQAPKPAVKVRYDDGILDDMDVAEVVLALRDVIDNQAKERVKTPNVVVLTDALRDVRAPEKPPPGGATHGPGGAHGAGARKKSVPGGADKGEPPRNLSPKRQEDLEWLKQFDLDAIRAEAEKDKNALPTIKVKKYLTVKAHAARDMTPEERLALLRMETKGYSLSVIQAWELMQHFEDTELQYEGSSFLITKVAGPKQREKLLQMKQAVQAGSRILAAREQSRALESDEDLMSDDDGPVRHWTAEDRGFDDDEGSFLSKKVGKESPGGAILGRQGSRNLKGRSGLYRAPSQASAEPASAFSGTQNRMYVEPDEEDEAFAANLSAFASSANFDSSMMSVNFASTMGSFASAMDLSSSMAGGRMVDESPSSRRGGWGGAGVGKESPGVTLPPVLSARGGDGDGMSISQAAAPIGADSKKDKRDSKIANARAYLV